MTATASSEQATQSDAMTASFWRRPRARTLGKLALLAVAMVLVLFYRRPDQFLQPTMWVEDITVAFPSYAARGWMSLFDPIAGYYCLPVKVIHAIASGLSFRYLPEISLVLTLVFTYAVLSAVALAPTMLRMPFACAAMTLAIPSDSENFAVSLYAGWWGSLLALIPLLWRPDAKPAWLARSALLLVGGFSSPLIIGLVPLFALRAAVFRKRIEFAMLGGATLIAGIQALALRVGQPIGPENWSLAPTPIIEKFFGYFLLSPSSPGMEPVLVYAGAALLIFLLLSLARANRRDAWPAFLLLAGCLVVAILASTRRVPVEAIHPKLGGPRYFFYPFILLSWLLVQIAAAELRIFSAVATALLAVGARNAVDTAQRRHTAIDWRGDIASCLRGGPNDVFLLGGHFDGNEKQVIRVLVAGRDCTRLVRNSLFANRIP